MIVALTVACCGVVALAVWAVVQHVRLVKMHAKYCEAFDAMVDGLESLEENVQAVARVTVKHEELLKVPHAREVEE